MTPPPPTMMAVKSLAMRQDKMAPHHRLKNLFWNKFDMSENHYLFAAKYLSRDVFYREDVY